MIMMKRYKKILLTGVLSALSCSFVHAQELYKNENAPVHERVMDLISRLTVEEKISLLRATSPGIPRLGIDKYYHGNEALHGVVRPGRFTVFPPVSYTHLDVYKRQSGKMADCMCTLLMTLLLRVDVT